jgi:2',3'-cyclic-nucleotide 2'-phosphodiesterase (5'-nucleotidase family)
VPWARPYRIVAVAGLRVGVVGFLTPTTPSITHPEAGSLWFQDPGLALTDVRKELEGRVDWILPITHLGVVDDRRLAKAHPDLDVIVGGHSHTYLKEGLRQGETFIVQAGSKASAVGRLDLWFDPDSKQLSKLEYRLDDLLEEPAPADRNAAVDRICNALVARSEREMNEPVGELLEPLERTFRRLNSTPGGNLITDTMRSALGADVAVQNRGGIRCDLPRGPVTRRSLFELLPFGNHLVLLELSGEDLFQCVRASVEGTAHTGLEVSGVTIVYRLEGDEPFLVDLELAGEPIDRARNYRLATNNFLAGGGDGYEILKRQRVLREDPTRLREVLEQRFRREGKVELPGDERYREARP